MKEKKKMKTWKKVVLIIVAIVVMIGIGGILIVRHMFSDRGIESGTPSDKATIHMEKGDIRGSIEAGIYQYLGVPYAVAKERFVPAEDVEEWNGVFDALEVGPMSPQSALLGMSAGDQSGNDDNCQTLNIWTPGIEDGKKRAVMVWLHGGGFSTGSANSEDYNGVELSSYGDVVVVGVNHRLGLSGFLDLSAYGDKYQYSGNAGFTDIVKALEWIQENIEYFGGDPDNVTVFGQSGGGAKVLALMTSPYAKGLFHRGIVQSGATETMGVTFTSKESSQALTERILANLNISEENLDELQNLDWEVLEEASVNALQETATEFQIPAPFGGYAMEWGPVVEGDYIPSNPVTADSFAETGKDIDLLIGSNLNEWTSFMESEQVTVNDEVLMAYQEAYPLKNSENANMVDTLIRMPALKIMTNKADQDGADVYAYVFAYDEGFGGAYHGAEIPYVFHHQSGKLGDQISKLWINFAKTGIPSAEGIPAWEPYTRENGATMILDTESQMGYGHDKKLIELLEPDYEY